MIDEERELQFHHMNHHERQPTGSDRPATPPYRVQVLERAIAILELLAEQNSALGLGRISRALRLNKTTAHRLLSVLEHHHFVEKNGSDGQYSLGSNFELGNRAVSRLDLLQRARPFLRRLVDETGETAHLAVLRQGEVLSLANVESPRTLRTPSSVGRRSPAHCTSIGKAILAYRPETEADEAIRTHGLLKFTERTITSPGAFKRELRHVREQGYAMDDEEFEYGLRCIGAPVRDRTGEVIGAVSVTGPAIRLTKERMPALIRCVVETVVETVAELSAGLGYIGDKQEG